MAEEVAPFAKLKKFTYPRTRYGDSTLGGQNLKRRCPLDNGQYHVVPRFDLGVLDELPLELVCGILVQVGLRTLTDFRQINQRAIQVVDSIPEYRTILRHSPGSLRAILAIEIGLHITCQDLIRTLSSPKCENCGDFGGYIYLLTCSRVCILCFTNELQYLPLLASEAVRQFEMPLRLVKPLPHIRSVPGKYSLGARTSRSARHVLFEWKSVYRAGVALRGSEATVEQLVAERARHRQTPNTYLRDGKEANPKRFMAVVPAPWVDALTEQTVWGFHCMGCKDESCPDRPLGHMRIYNVETFEDHLRQCGPIVDVPSYPDLRMHDQARAGIEFWRQSSSDEASECECECESECECWCWCWNEH